jgi:hypothetical protein
MVDIEYFVREFRDEGHEVVVFMDANQNESRCYRPQTHDHKFKSDTGFNIDGSLKTFVQNTGLHNILNTKHGDENVPPCQLSTMSTSIQILIQKRTNGIVFDNDAKGCYDRIISGIVLLSIRRLGYSKNSVNMLGKLWEKLEHHISTGFGMSDI